jgi:hypothetical protein
MNNRSDARDTPAARMATRAASLWRPRYRANVESTVADQPTKLTHELADGLASAKTGLPKRGHARANQ